METYMWLILASMLAVGVVFGFFIGRSKGDTSAPKVRELEQNLSKANEEMQEYRTHVTQHFEKTANLFNQLTNDYREVYEHLANSSDQLCGDQVAKLKSLTSDKNVLEGEGEKLESSTSEARVAESATAEPAQQEPAAAEPAIQEAASQATETAPETEEKQVATETEAATAAEEKKGDGSSDEPVVPPVTETAPADQPPGEHRIIH